MLRFLDLQDEAGMFRFIDLQDVVIAELYEREPARSGLLRGTGVSRGSAAGVTRVAAKAPGPEGFQDGDVVVVPDASPRWAALLNNAAAVISETGGALSSLALVARELGVPAVFGVSQATELIPDGATVEVNGTTGTVRWGQRGCSS
jgi:pyruvate,water dikinase